jgi:PAS domain S-box-containing protein
MHNQETTPSRWSGLARMLKSKLAELLVPSLAEVRAWKQQLANNILRSSFAVAILLLGAGAYYAYTIDAVWLITFYVILVGLWILIAFLPKISYALRAWILLFLIYAVAILDLFEAGRTGSARVFLIALPVLSLLLFDWRIGVLTLGGCLTTLAGFGWLYSTGQLVAALEIANSTNPAIWISNTLVFFFISVLLMASANYLIHRLARAVLHLKDSVKTTQDALSLQQAVFDATADGILAVDHTGRITTANRKFAELWGIPESVIAARNDAAAIDSVLEQVTDPVGFTAKIRALYEQPHAESFDLLHLKDGRVLERHSSPQWLDNDIIGRVWVFRDVTAQKQIEAALERERILLRNLVDTMPAIIFAKDTDGRKILANTGDQDAMGVQSEAAAIGKTDFEIYPPEKAAKYAEEDRRVLEDGEIFETESMFVDKHTGQQQWVSGSKRPLRNEAGQIIGLIGSFYNITRIKQGEIEREKLIAELEAKNAELERFTYTVSHDLKSPLITIGGFAGFLQEDLLNGDIVQAQNDMARINDALARMEQLLEDLLELSRIGRQMNPPDTAAFEAIAREAVELVRGRITAGKVTVEIMPGLPAVYGDRARLVEVVQNLVDNACKYMGDTPDPRIEIGARQTETETVFYVRDNGIGIEPQYREKIFELFDKLDPTSEGAGVGLAIVKRIIETHGGRIWVDSEGNRRGSTFLFTLSAAQ